MAAVVPAATSYKSGWKGKGGDEELVKQGACIAVSIDMLQIVAWYMIHGIYRVSQKRKVTDAAVAQKKIEYRGAKFSHGYDLGALDSAW